MTRKSVKFRHATKWLLSPIMLKIRNGPLEGRKWKASSGIRFIKGIYEPKNVDHESGAVEMIVAPQP